MNGRCDIVNPAVLRENSGRFKIMGESVRKIIQMGGTFLIIAIELAAPKVDGLTECHFIRLLQPH